LEICKVTQKSMAKYNGSIPRSLTIGVKIGTRIKIMPTQSITQPIIKMRNKITNNIPIFPKGRPNRKPFTSWMAPIERKTVQKSLPAKAIKSTMLDILNVTIADSLSFSHVRFL